MFMPDSIRSVAASWPVQDSAAPESVAGEKDACGVGFLAQLSGEASHWVLQQALRGLGCMEHRGGCGGDGDSGDGAGVLCEIPWGYLKAIWPEAVNARGLGMMFLPTDQSRRQGPVSFVRRRLLPLVCPRRGGVLSPWMQRYWGPSPAKRLR